MRPIPWTLKNVRFFLHLQRASPRAAFSHAACCAHIDTCVIILLRGHTWRRGLARTRGRRKYSPREPPGPVHTPYVLTEQFQETFFSTAYIYVYVLDRRDLRCNPMKILPAISDFWLFLLPLGTMRPHVRVLYYVYYIYYVHIDIIDWKGRCWDSVYLVYIYIFVYKSAAAGREDRENKQRGDVFRFSTDLFDRVDL